MAARIRLRMALPLLVLSAGLGLAWGGRAGAAEEAERREAVETSRIRGWARSQGGAGVSVLPKRVPVASGRTLRRVETVPGYDAYTMRCASCHELPDPAAYPAGRWGGKVDEMDEHIRRAGVVPPPEAELDSVRRFLRAAAEGLRE